MSQHPEKIEEEELKIEELPSLGSFESFFKIFPNFNKK